MKKYDAILAWNCEDRINISYTAQKYKNDISDKSFSRQTKMLNTGWLPVLAYAYSIL